MGSYAGAGLADGTVTDSFATLAFHQFAREQVGYFLAIFTFHGNRSAASSTRDLGSALTTNNLCLNWLFAGQCNESSECESQC